MKGHVKTPEKITFKMVSKLFRDKLPKEGDRILYPGVGTGPFVAAVKEYCQEKNLPVPLGLGIEKDPELLVEAREKYSKLNVDLVEGDFLEDEKEYGSFKYIVGNPPYVPIEGLSEEEKEYYRKKFKTAIGRFDLYILFFEQAIRLLDENGRLVFVTPEKFEYVETARAIRKILTKHHVKEIEHIDEDSFEGLVTYPTITTLDNSEHGKTQVVSRTGEKKTVTLSQDGSSWAPKIRNNENLDISGGFTLEDISIRISCGVATGADKIFVKKKQSLPPQLENWGFPTVSGRQLTVNDGPYTDSVFISPYNKNGELLSEEDLGSFIDWAEIHKNRLESRSCVEKEGKKWYAWHENPPMKDILKPKILCKDVTKDPKFWPEPEGKVIPRHSAYYIVPKNPEEINGLVSYLNSSSVSKWLEANCQRAANGYLRLQSKILKKLPVPVSVTKQKSIKATA